MKRCNWQSTATTWFKRQGTVALLAAVALIGVPGAVRADVVGEGDVTPVFPALPFDGGVVAGDVIVGGTATVDPLPITTIGILTIDVPAFTDPLISDNGYVGFNADGIGQVTVAGFLSEWSVNEKMSVGVNGQGYLTVSGGALVRSNLTGADTDPDAFVGEFLGSQGFVTITGVGSQWQNDNLIVGHQGTGTITVQSGAWLRTQFDAIVGEDVATVSGVDAIGRGTVVVTGTGSRWNIAERLTVGGEGRGEVQVLAGGLIRAGEPVVIADEGGSYGKATVSGQGSQLWAEETLVIATTAESQAEVYVNDLGILRADTSIALGEQGFINLAGGTILTPTITSAGVIRGAGTIDGVITNDGDIRNAAGVANTRERLLFTGAVTNNDNIESVGGEMEFKGNVTNNSPNGDIYGKDAIFRFIGPAGLVNNSRVTLDDSIVESTNFVNNAALAVVASETSTIFGDLTLSASSILEMELGDDFSQLWVTGNANIGGTLELSLSPGFAPVTGDSFEILRSDSLSGTFSLEVLTANPGLLWEVDYTNDSVFVTFGAAAPPGSGADFNGDNIVDAQDLAIWHANFGVGSNPPPAATQAQGDANGDGVVDGADFMLIQQKFGGPPALPASGDSLAAVPEPSSVVLALATFGLPLASRRRRN
jgi:T5SS/PEP-CTERM-associated repeat protein